MFNHVKSFLYLILLTALTLSVSSTAVANQLRAELLRAADTKASGEYVRNRFLKIMRKPFVANGKKKALIIGDSHAQDFLNSVLENGYLRNYQISTRYIPTRCQIFLGNKAQQSIAAKDKVFCAKADSLSKARQQIGEADVVILASNWKAWSAQRLPQTIKNLALKPQQKLFVLGRKSFGKVAIRSYLRMPEAKLRGLRSKVDAHQVKINTILRSSLSGSIFVDQHRLICGSASSCPVFTPDMKLISYDGGHFTKEGARYAGRKIFQGSGLGRL